MTLSRSDRFYLGSLVVLAAAIGAVTHPGAIRAHTAPRGLWAREAITAHVGDTLSPQFFIRTDTILAAVPVFDSASGTTKANIVAAHCGTGFFFARLYRRSAGKITTAMNGDTVAVTVTGCTTGTTPAPALQAITTLGSASGCWSIDKIKAAGVAPDTSVVFGDLFPRCDTTKAAPK